MTNSDTNQNKHQIAEFAENAHEAFRQLRTRVQFTSPDAKIIAMVGDQGEVKSQSSLEFAKSLVAANKRVLLIDADLESSLLTKQFDLEVSEGFNNLIADGVFKESMIKSLNHMSLDFLPVAQVIENSTDLTDIEMLQAEIEKLKAQYDYIVIDTITLSSREDAYLISKVSDIAIFVAAENKTKISDLNYYQSRFVESHINLAGSVFVKTK